MKYVLHGEYARTNGTNQQIFFLVEVAFSIFDYFSETEIIFKKYTVIL